jgi:hypothetical protein
MTMQKNNAEQKIEKNNMNNHEKKEPTDESAGSPMPAFYAVIPASVRYCNELELGARLLYGELTALANQHGYCFSSNEYFAALYKVNIRTIQLWLNSLKKHKFISIEICKDGLKTSRKIWITPEIQKMFARRNNFHGRHEKNFTQGTPSPYILNNTYKSSSSSSRAPPKRRLPPPPIIFDEEKRKFTGITDEDIKAWKEKFPHLDIEKQLALCAEWAVGEPRKNYRKSILAWFSNAKNTETKNFDTAKEDAILAQKVWNKFKGRKEKDISLSASYLEFIQGVNAPSLVLNFGSKDFRIKVLEQLRKRNLPTEGL